VLKQYDCCINGGYQGNTSASFSSSKMHHVLSMGHWTDTD